MTITSRTTAVRNPSGLPPITCKPSPEEARALAIALLHHATRIDCKSH